MNSELFRPPTAAAIQNMLRTLKTVAIALLALTACSPPSTDDSGSEQPAEATADEPAEAPVTELSVLEALLERLAEPALAGNCVPDTTTYRISRLVWEEGAAAVRVFSREDDHGYRSVFSPAIGQAMSSDGWLDDRQWNRVETEFQFSGFWDIGTDEFADEYARGVMFVEACKDGEYHYIESDPRNAWLSRLVEMLSRIGKLQWLATGRRDFG